MDKYIGFDVSSKSTVACVYDPVAKRSRFATLPTELPSLQDWLRTERSDGDRLHLTFEAGSLSGLLYDGLVGAVDELAVSHPGKLTWIYRDSVKTDRIDAEKQAKLYAMGLLPTVHMPRSFVRQWRRLIQHRRRLVSHSTSIKCRIRDLLKSQGQAKPDASGWWGLKTRAWMIELAEAKAEPWRWMLEDLLTQLETVETLRDRTTRRLDGILAKAPGAVLLQTIPGVGPRTAEAVLAYTDQIDRFGSGKSYAAYFGMTPRLDESGARSRRGHISKRGPSVVRWLIVEAAWQAIRRSPALRRFFGRVRKGRTDRRKIAVVATARKLLTIMRAMLRTGEVFNEDLVARSHLEERVAVEIDA